MQHPGARLGEMLKASQIRQSVLCRRLDICPTQINEIIKGKRPMTISIAFALESVLLLTAKKWLYMQVDYDLFVAAQKQESKPQEAG